MGSESHGPTEEQVQAAWPAMAKSLRDPGKHTYDVAARAALEAAYPLIREQLCQELAEAIRERWDRNDHAVAAFVESFALEGSVPADQEPE